MVVVFWLVVFLGWSPGASVSQAFYAQVCPANRLIQVVWNESLGQYQHVNENNNDYNVFSKENNDNNDNSSSSSIATNNDNNNNTTTEFLRECNCPRPIYHPAYVCPQEARFCAIPVELSDPVLCFQENTSVTLVRNIWPLVCLWYLCFLIFLCCSFRGRHALTFCVNRCFPGTNEILVSRMIVDRRAEQQRIWNFWNNNNNNNNNNNASAVSAGPTTNEYVLKTKRFHSENPQLPPPPQVPSKPEDNLTLNHGDHVNQEGSSSEQQQNNNNEEEEEEENFDDPATCCTICFVPLEEGDRIGDLTCGHVYHVECLKGWLQRKNTCPLCAAPLATPREEENKPPEENDNDDQEEESSSNSEEEANNSNSNNNNNTP